MTEPAETGQLLKADKRGRVQVPVPRREALLDEFERSGMSGIEFAGHYGIKYPTFAAWRQKRKKARASTPEGGAPEFFVVEASGSEFSGAVSRPGKSLQIDLPGGARLTVRSRDEIALAVELLRALR